MKRIVLLAMVMMSVFLMGATEKDNIYVTSGTVLTSTADQAIWSTGTTDLSISAGTNIGNYFRLGKVVISEANATEVQKRYVSIWMIDQDENIPLSKSLLYEKTMLFTDKTPDEIRADIPLMKLLEKHNEMRETLKDKEGKSLKKIRLRDIQIRILSW